MSIVIDVASLEQRIKKIKDEFHQKKGKYITYVESKDIKCKEKEKLEKKHERLDKTRVMFMQSAEYQREKIKVEFENIVTNALQFIRNEDISFEIDIEEKRGRAEAKFFVKTVRDGVVNRKPLENTSLKDSKGDGVSSIVKIALNVALLELSGQEGPLVLDEPAKEISKEYIDNTSEFLKQISEAFGRQIIMITHIDKMSNVADKKFIFSLEGVISKVEEILLNAA
ncbi:hypothetical protein [Alkaliphilus sp. B6464]|uniref:hypothetical protein n=1 Tax=Alkaliphilus sp. B6464 TaxID=2731219 RepID=UPI001BA7936C|nr:hypothetical protein [Alkaliphilus sp. B6464]QUH22065.1 ATP-binding protein [Alkaliphilus sp. B6464]